MRDSISKKDLFYSKGLYFIDNNMKNSMFLKKLIDLKLLNFFNKENNNFNFLVEQGNFIKYSMKNEFFKNFNTNFYMFLPTTTFYESSDTYLNTENIFKKTIKIISPLNLSKLNWQIIRKFISYVDRNCFTYDNNINKIYNLKNNFLMSKFISFHYFPLDNYNNLYYKVNNKPNKQQISDKYNIKKIKLYNVKPLLLIDDFYIGGTDKYSNFSKIMIECSKTLRLNTTNFNYVI